MQIAPSLCANSFSSAGIFLYFSFQCYVFERNYFNCFSCPDPDPSIWSYQDFLESTQGSAVWEPTEALSNEKSFMKTTNIQYLCWMALFCVLNDLVARDASWSKVARGTCPRNCWEFFSRIAFFFGRRGAKSLQGFPTKSRQISSTNFWRVRQFFQIFKNLEPHQIPWYPLFLLNPFIFLLGMEGKGGLPSTSLEFPKPPFLIPTFGLFWFASSLLAPL